MPMNAVLLASEMKDAMDAVANSYKDGTKDNQDMLTALANSIVTHIQTNAQVIVASGSSAGTYPVL